MDVTDPGRLHRPACLIDQPIGDLVNVGPEGVVAQRDQAPESSIGQRGPQRPPDVFGAGVSVDEQHR